MVQIAEPMFRLILKFQSILNCFNNVIWILNLEATQAAGLFA